jgi:hypothetical protein
MMNAGTKTVCIRGESFRDIGPACTFVQVSRFIGKQWLVEIEADAVVR